MSVINNDSKIFGLMELQKIFPNKEITVNGRQWEVNVLEKNYQPSGNILRNAESCFSVINDRHEWFIVEQDAYQFLFRICTAMENSGYDEYAVIHYIATNDDIKYINEYFDRQTGNYL